MMEISVILPAYKEAENLKTILPQIKEALLSCQCESEILVVDTMEAMDDTKEACKDNDVRYINRKNGNSYGDAIRTGLAEAQGKYLVYMDADGSHDPKSIPELYKNIGEYNLVIGSRYCKGGHTDNPFILRFMSYMLNVTYRLVFGLKVKDVSNSFRMYRKEEVEKFELECDNFDIVEEILIKLNYTVPGFKALEIPISFNKRMAGQSKRDLVKFIVSYLKTMDRLLKIKKTVHK